MEKYKLLGGCRDDVYNDLRTLRKYRNKIHIYSTINLRPRVPANESQAFSDDVLKWALSLCSDVIEFLNNHFARPIHIQGFLKDLNFPVWVGS